MHHRLEHAVEAAHLYCFCAFDARFGGGFFVPGQHIKQRTAFEVTGDLFDGSHVVEATTSELREAAQAELDDVLSMGGAFEAVETLKARLVASMAERTRRIESGEQTVVGVNDFTDTAESPLGGEGAIPPSTRRWATR